MDRTIIDFTREDHGTGTLTRAVPRVDSQIPGTQEWDLDIMFTVVDDLQTEHVHGVLPSATEYLTRAMEGRGGTTITVKPSQRDIRLTLTTQDGQVVLSDVHTEVRHIRLSVTEKVQVYVSRVRLPALTPEQGAAILGVLGTEVTLFVTQDQIALDFGNGAELGSLVCGVTGDVSQFGILRQKRGTLFMVEDFGVIHTVDRVTAALSITQESLDRAEQCADQIRQMGGTPSWADFVDGMANQDTQQITPEVAQWVLEGHQTSKAVTGG